MNFVFIGLGIILVVVFDFVRRVLREKLEEGEYDYRIGRNKLAEKDNWFTQIFFSDRLVAGRNKLLEGERKLQNGRIIYGCIIFFEWVSIAFLVYRLFFG